MDRQLEGQTDMDAHTQTRGTMQIMTPHLDNEAVQ